MSGQQRSLVRWTLIWLAISIVLAVASVLNEGGLSSSEIDHYNIWNPGVIGYWTGRIGFMPLIAIIVVTAKTFRASGALKSALNASLAIVSLVLLIPIGFVLFAAALPVEDRPFARGRARTDFVATVLNSCTTRQKAMPENKAVSEDAITNVCTCYANAVADSTRAADVLSSKGDAPSPSHADRMNASWQKCLQP